MTNISDTIDAIMRDLAAGKTRQTVIDYHTLNRPDADKVKAIVSDVESGKPAALVIAYHTSGDAPRATQARVVQQTGSVPRGRPRGTRPQPAPRAGSPDIIEGMEARDLVPELRKLSGRHSYDSIARHIQRTDCPPYTYSPATVRLWALGKVTPSVTSMGDIRGFLIRHRNGQTKLTQLGLRAATGSAAPPPG